MTNRLLYLILVLSLACEEVVNVDLPDAQNQIVVEGWVSDSLSNHPIRVTQSLDFDSEVPFLAIETATIIVQSRDGEVFDYQYQGDGFYVAISDYQGSPGSQYRVRIDLDTAEIRSDWDQMPEPVAIETLEVESFEDVDPNDSNNEITIYYPKITTRDPVNVDNFYRWIFYKNGLIFNDPDPITVQDDRLFDGNLIPNNFQNFDYEIGDEMTVELTSISQRAFNYLSLLSSQLTTLGTSSGTTPAIVEGNLFIVNNTSTQVLGYFGSRSISSETQIVE